MEKQRSRSISEISEKPNTCFLEFLDEIEENIQKLTGKEGYTIQEVSAQSYLEVLVKCPYCLHHQDISHQEEVAESFSRSGELRADDLEIEVTCFECERDFIVNRIDF